MAKKSKIARNEHRKAVVERYAARRAELKELIRRPGTPEAERLAAQAELRRQPRDASATRVRNRDSVDGRRAATCGSSGCPGSGSASPRTRASCPECASPPGRTAARGGP